MSLVKMRRPGRVRVRARWQRASRAETLRGVGTCVALIAIAIGGVAAAFLFFGQ